MSRYKIKSEWNGNKGKNDPQNEYQENLIYILYKENKLDCYFESQRLINGFLKHDHVEGIKEIHYDKEDQRPVAVRGLLPLSVLTLKSKPRKEAYAKSVIP